MRYAQQLGVNVVREKAKGLAVSVCFLSTLREDWLNISLSLPGLNVVSAYLETPRHHEGLTSRARLKSLEGLEAYLHATPAIKAAMMPYEQDASRHYTRLVLEAVIGVLQAETFFFEERGFSSSAAYEQYWREMYRNQCRYYSNLDRVQRDFTAYAGGSRRGQLLFTRFNQLQVKGEEEGLCRGEAYLSDSFHEMRAWWEVNSASREVMGAGARVIRAPDSVCFETEALWNELKGWKLLPENTGALRRILGGSQGCAHLADMGAGFIRTLEMIRAKET